MSPVLKCILGLFIVLCFVQFIQMATVPMDEETANEFSKKLGELAPNLKKVFNDELSHLKETFEADGFKNIMTSGTKQLNSFLENVQKATEQIKLN